MKWCLRIYMTTNRSNGVVFFTFLSIYGCRCSSQKKHTHIVTCYVSQEAVDMFSLEKMWAPSRYAHLYRNAIAPNMFINLWFWIALATAPLSFVFHWWIHFWIHIYLSINHTYVCNGLFFIKNPLVFQYMVEPLFYYHITKASHYSQRVYNSISYSATTGNMK